VSYSLWRWVKRRGREPLFIHIPKTGGTFVGQLETDSIPVVSPVKYLGHVTVLDPDGSFELDVARPYQQDLIVPRSKFKGATAFSNVRNIFTFLVSYLHHAGGINPRYRDTEHYDYTAAQKGFDYLVRTIADRENLWPSRRFIHYNFFAQPSGNFLPHWLNQTDFLDEDLRAMAKKFGLEIRQRTKQRVSGYSDHRSYYDDSLVDLVSSTWAREIDLFGFDFEAKNRFERPKVLRYLAKSSYVWRHDRFTAPPASIAARFASSCRMIFGQDVTPS
jgi:hypothetical protein